MQIRYDGLTVWNGEDELVQDASLIIDENGRIAWMGPSVEIPVPWRALSARDGRGKLALPGLVNAHTHLYSSLARGLAVEPFDPSSFTQVLEQLWWRLDKALDPSAIRASALVGAMEAARCGVTTLIDHHASPSSIPGSLDIVRDAVVDTVGLRGVFCYEISDRDGEHRRDQGLDETARFLSRPLTDRAAAQIGLHASFTLSDETLEKVSEMMPAGVGIHIHVAEGPEDEVLCEQEHGARILPRLDRFGMLRPSSVLAHCLHINEDEKDLAAERDTIVVHNPRSNMNNAVGSFDMEGMLRRGILTGLGTDGLGTHMLSELFTAGLLQKHVQRTSTAAGFDALHRMLFVNNPAIASRLLNVPLGRIQLGTPADVVLVKYVPPTPMTAKNILGHLLFGLAVGAMHVSDVFVSGHPILNGGRFVSIDEEAIYADARREAAALWSRLG